VLPSTSQAVSFYVTASIAVPSLWHQP
jgi:hypothetical protein